MVWDGKDTFGGSDPGRVPADGQPEFIPSAVGSWVTVTNPVGLGVVSAFKFQRGVKVSIYARRVGSAQTRGRINRSVLFPQPSDQVIDPWISSINAPTLTINWDAVTGATGYEVYRSKQSTTTSDLSGVSWTNETLAASARSKSFAVVSNEYISVQVRPTGGEWSEEVLINGIPNINVPSYQPGAAPTISSVTTNARRLRFQGSPGLNAINTLVLELREQGGDWARFSVKPEGGRYWTPILKPGTQYDSSRGEV